MESKLILFRSEQRFIDALIYIRNYDDRIRKIADDARMNTAIPTMISRCLY